MTTLLAKSVTANTSLARCATVSRHDDEPETANAVPETWPVVIRNAYQTLAGFVLEGDREGWVSCAACGGKSYQRHCLTHHQQPEYRDFEYNGEPHRRPVPTGVDRYMCSSTCRVRAFNFYHHTPQGMARKAEEDQRRAEWMEALTKAWGGGVSDERKRAREAISQGHICGRCGAQLVDGAPVYRQSVHGEHTVVCEACRWQEVWIRWRGPLPCQGCDRPVFVKAAQVRYGYGREGRYGPKTTCSRRCGQDAAYRRQKARRAADREPIDCPACHERFEPARADARYCSPKCRQVAYRARRAA
jgi:hypothetical protein